MTLDLAGIGALAVASLLSMGACLAEESPGFECEPGFPHYTPRDIAFPSGASYVTPEGKIRVVGYNDMTEMLTAIGALFTARHPDFGFEFVLKGTRTAPSALANGMSALAPMGAEFSAAELDAYRTAQGNDPQLFSIAHDSLDPHALSSPAGFYVHASNPLSQITLEQARRVFAASSAQPAITWGDLGLQGAWAARPIHPRGLGADLAIGLFVRARALEGSALVSTFTAHPQSREVVAALAGDPTGIAFANLNHATPGVKLLAITDATSGQSTRGSREDLQAGRYPLDRRLLIYARRAPGGGLADPVAGEFLRLALSCEGQRAIAGGSLGYVPLGAQQAAEERTRITP